MGNDVGMVQQGMGILGGTFNPIHHGHLRIAVEVYERFDLQEVRLIPAAYPVHRAVPTVSPLQRLQMVQAAIAGVQGLRVDDREIHRAMPSYTIDTLRSLRADYPTAILYWIIGMDAFQQFHTWHEWEKILLISHLIVINRPNIPSLSEAHPLYAYWSEHHTFETNLVEKSGQIFMLQLPELAISSTYIRERLAAGGDVSYLLPAPVLTMINTYQLYSPTIAPC